MRALSIILLLIGWLSQGYAQQSFGIAYYNVDGLYDTIPSPSNEDREYRSHGPKHWSAEKYLRKVRGVVQVIDSMAMPVVGLYGVESGSRFHHRLRHYLPEHPRVRIFQGQQNKFPERMLPRKYRFPISYSRHLFL